MDAIRILLGSGIVAWMAFLAIGSLLTLKWTAALFPPGRAYRFIVPIVAVLIAIAVARDMVVPSSPLAKGFVMGSVIGYAMVDASKLVASFFSKSPSDLSVGHRLALLVTASMGFGYFLLLIPKT